MTSLKAVNAKIAHLGIELCKHYDYFYFMETSDTYPANGVPDSVYVRSINSLSLQQWIDHATNKETLS